MAAKSGSGGSKTARASVRAGAKVAAGAVAVQGDVVFLIPLNDGRGAYIRDVTRSKTVQAPVGSEPFYVALDNLVAAGHAVKVQSEVSQLAERFHNWAPVIEHMAASAS